MPARWWSRASQFLQPVQRWQTHSFVAEGVVIVAIASTEFFVLNGMSIIGAIAPTAVHKLLREPSRIDTGSRPAPYGHRNNQIHVYDSLGIYFNEHHHTRLLEGMTFVFWPDEQCYRFTPECSFSGRLCLGGFDVPHQVLERDLLPKCGLPFKRHLAGAWALDGTLSIGIETKGGKLKSGRRSAVRRLVSVDIGWPHDPRGAPLTNGGN